MPCRRGESVFPARRPVAPRAASPTVGGPERSRLLGQPLESLVQRLVSLLHLFPIVPTPIVRAVHGLRDFRSHARVGDKLHTLPRHGQSLVRLNDDLFSPSSCRHFIGTLFPERSSAL